MANSITDVFAAMQNGVIALGKFQKQLTGSFNNISVQLSSINGRLIPASSSQFGLVEVDGTTITSAAGVISIATTPLTKSTSVDIALNNIANYFDGPSVAQGSSGTWFASGQVTCLDTAGTASMVCKLWDGTTIIDSALDTAPAANARVVVALSGFITSPTGNIKISVQDGTSVNGKILFNASGNSKDSTLTAFRIG